MKKLTLLICLAVFSAFAQTQIIVLAGQTKILRNQTFENFSGDFVIKNHGTLIIENSTFRNNALGGTNKDDNFVEEKRIVAPIINLGTLSISNSRFENNFSRNSSITENLSAQISAGVVANFGDLTLYDDNTFTNNLFQRGFFTVLRNTSVQRIDYIGNDTVFNVGNVKLKQTEQAENTQRFVNTDLEVETAIAQNPVPVNENARVFVRTNRQANVRVTIFDALNNVVFSTQRQVEGVFIFEWNLTNQSGQRVSGSAFSVRVEAENFIENLQLGVRR